MKISLITMRPAIADKKENLKKMKEHIQSEQAELFIFGEATLVGYRCQDALQTLAEPLNGPSISSVQKMAEEKGSHILFGMPLLDEKRKGLYHNAAILVYPDGKVGVYKKWFLPNFGPFQEKLFFDEGETLPIFKTKMGSIGIMICYDLFFPELAKAYALQGADIIICISASPTTSKRFFEPLFPARAIENTTYFVFTNIVGPQQDLVFWGGSQAFDPYGNMITKAPYHQESHISCDLDVRIIPTIRSHRPTIRDTRPTLFQDLYKISRNHQLLTRKKR